ncbi:VOC family protein [Leptothoe kymatousa]|uniref:VOC family protein n=1 Tax=Leptothoe kymatousa TAU-MAC 1615 TaxID=2364775 RepID=A0ABS5Y5L6_9CYAN|nr:VOC family protein [Leptothoe kymatousa]MBT9312808.1 VOC family protein [Leptothoe kymatousa TAU-MAC 1615]
MSQEANAIQGIYEVCIGTQNAQPLIQYWQQFGYTPGETGEISAEFAQQLYGVESSLRSVRLDHQAADHGLIRLMVWDRPPSQGLGMAPMKVRGNRWATSLTLNVANLWNHAAEAEAQGLPIRYGPPQWTVIYPTAQGRPFLDPLVGVREMLLLQPQTRQVMFQRFNYTVPDYGQPNLASPFQASQVTHMGLVLQDDSRETLRFYDETLGLLRVQDELESTYETARGGRQIFDLQPGERFWVTAFDDPRSSKTDWQAARSGRLYIVRFPEALTLPDYSDYSRPGALGLSLYTYRVGNVDAYYELIRHSPATALTNIMVNEFGERSFSFKAPDGYTWTFLGKPSTSH